MSKVAYFHAKNAPTTSPGIEYITNDEPAAAASIKARAPEAKQAIISISREVFVAAMSPFHIIRRYKKPFSDAASQGIKRDRP